MPLISGYFFRWRPIQLDLRQDFAVRRALQIDRGFFEDADNLALPALPLSLVCFFAARFRYGKLSFEFSGRCLMRNSDFDQFFFLNRPRKNQGVGKRQ
jgi:hypothetical protein